MSPSAPSPAPALDSRAPDARRRHALLVELGEAERDMWVRGGREALRRRAAALKAALAGGCRVQDVAEVLQVKATDLQPWLTPLTPLAIGPHRSDAALVGPAQMVNGVTP